ncbi:CHAT domain-containing protein [Streptomyces sp. NPDC002659]|uniref:CHAT domain-containing protein n=1 Tax=Streptomyces sp. NPDC002659 TaxID=3364656 RepID=UPI00368429AF
MKSLDFHVEVGTGGLSGDAGPGGPRTYEITLRGPDGGETSAQSPFPLPPEELRVLDTTISLAVLSSYAQLRRSATADERPVQELGGRLFDFLMAGEGRSLFAAARHRVAREERPLRIVLRVRAPELARLPWEFLFDRGENSYVCPTMPLVRHPSVSAPRRALRVDPPLRVLCMAARPDDQGELAVRAERAWLTEALSGLVGEGLIEIAWTAGETWRDLRAALRGNGEPWHALHFIGHGGFDADEQEGTLLLAGEKGGTYELGAENLAMLVEGHPSLRLVVLNACQSGRSSDRDPFSSVAGALMQKGLPAAVAMQYSISDGAAVEFSRTFYETLAHRRPVDEAVTEARQAVRLAQRRTLEWGTPVLYMRALDGLLFDIGETPPAAAPVGLHDLYVQGLAAFYQRRWDDAVEAFRAVVARDGGHQDAVAKLAEAERKRRLEHLYTAGTGAAAEGHWAAAVDHLEAVVAADPDFRDAAERLAEAVTRREVTVLRAEAADLHDAGEWSAVLAVGVRLAELAPEDPDPDGVVSTARGELERVDEPEPAADTSFTDGSLARDWGVPSAREPQVPEPEPAAGRVVPHASGPAPDWGFMRAASKAARDSADVQLHLERAPLAYAFSPDSVRLAIACTGRSAVVFDAYGKRVVHVQEGMTRRFREVWDADVYRADAVALSPGGNRLLTGRSRSLRVWDVDSGRDIKELTSDVRAGCRISLGVGIANSPVLLVQPYGGGWIWPGPRDKVRAVDVGGYVRVAVVSPDGTRFAAVGSSAPPTWARGRHALEHVRRLSSAAPRLRVWDAATGVLQVDLACGDSVLDMAFSPVSNQVALSDEDGTVRVLDLATGEELRRFEHAGPVQKLAYNGDGTRLITAGGGTAQVWNMRTTAMVCRRVHNEGWEVQAVALGPDEQPRAVVVRDGAVWLTRVDKPENSREETA